MSRSWWFSATRDERGEDETVSAVWRSHLQKWRALHFIQRLVVLLLLLVYVCTLLVVSRWRRNAKDMSKNGTSCLQRHLVSVEKTE